MSDADAPAAKTSLSAAGAFLVGLVLGAGVLFVYHSYYVKGVNKTLKSDQDKIAVLEKGKNAALGELADLKRKLEPATPR